MAPPGLHLGTVSNGQRRAGARSQDMPRSPPSSCPPAAANTALATTRTATRPATAALCAPVHPCEHLEAAFAHRVPKIACRRRAQQQLASPQPYPIAAAVLLPAAPRAPTDERAPRNVHDLRDSAPASAAALRDLAATGRGAGGTRRLPPPTRSQLRTQPFAVAVRRARTPGTTPTRMIMRARGAASAPPLCGSRLQPREKSVEAVS